MGLMQYPFIKKKTNVCFRDRFRKKLIKLLLSFIVKKDSYTAAHCKRVMKLAVGFAKYCSYPVEKINTLKYASLLHDVGKITISKRILNKPGKLMHNEYNKIKKHPNTGFLIIQKVIFLREEAEVIRQHHERIDGLGYPYGLNAHEINELSKVLSVCDAFDAMTNNRVYRKMLKVEETVKELEKCAGTQFDRIVVESFQKYIQSRTKTLQANDGVQGGG